MVEETLKRLKELCRKERELLIKFPLGEPEEFLSLQEEKRELLLKLSSLEAEELEPFKELIEEIKEVQELSKPLLLSNLSFIEEVLGELAPRETYGPSEGKSLFNGKA